jgi:hypothetical protein
MPTASALAAFKRSVSRRAPPRGVAPALAALWWARKGVWDKAHEIVMNDEGGDGAWVHAYLHRAEGDLGNARYWYARARRSAASGPLKAEWEAIATKLLATRAR